MYETSCGVVEKPQLIAAEIRYVPASSDWRSAGSRIDNILGLYNGSN
jgi:hypothetical protein